MCEKCNGGCSNELPKITSVFLILTEKCSLACKYCFVKQNPREMTFDIAKDALEFIVENSRHVGDVPSINFFGGEPMLKYNEIIKPLIEYSVSKYGDGFVKFSMTSNGVHFNKENLKFLKKYNVGILMSLDGCKESHDANRVFHNGKGSFDKINKILDTYLELNPNNVLRCTLEENNCHLMIKNVEFAMEKGFKSIFFVPNSFAEWSDSSKTVLKEQVREFGDMFLDHMRNGKELNLNPFNVKISDIKRINDTQTRKYVIDGMHKCGLGANKFASVGTDGILYGCQEMTSNSRKDDIFKIGDIYKGEDNNKRKTLLSSFNSRDVLSHEKCSSCKLRYVCNGGCVANNYMQTGNLAKQADIMCFWEQILLDEAIRVTKILGEEGNYFFKDNYFNVRKG